jgi:SAM-dependent methyltransferase
MNVIEHNREAWNRESRQGSRWSTPVTSDVIRAARNGVWSVILTPTKAVPAEWFPALSGKAVLCLASGGGQQAPVIAAAGADVVSFDLSEEQLSKDREVAERENLVLRCVQGDMADLSALATASFDLVFHPVSNLFVPDVNVVWRECYRVLKPGGHLLAGFMNPWFFLFDHDAAERTGEVLVTHTLPHAALNNEADRPAEFSHSLETQIGGQIAAGFRIIGLYEDHWLDGSSPLNRFCPIAIATRAAKHDAEQPAAADGDRSINASLSLARTRGL